MSVDRTVVLERTLALLRALAGPDVAIDESSTLVGDLALESVDVIQLMAAVELEFSIVVDESDILPIARVGDLVDAVHAKLGEWA